MDMALSDLRWMTFVAAETHIATAACADRSGETRRRIATAAQSQVKEKNV